MPYPTCSITGCDNPVQARGWCPKHYGRWHDHGDPNTVTLSVAGRSGPVRVPLDYVITEKRAMAWAGQVRFDAAISKLR